MNVGQITSNHGSSHLGFIGFDLEGKILYASRKILTVLGLEHLDVSNVHELFYEHDPLINAAVEAVQGTFSQFQIKIQDQFFHIEMLPHSPLVQDADVVVIFTDITAMKTKELEMEERIRLLEESNKDLEMFAYVVSHDLNEPLRTIGNFTGLLDNEYKEYLPTKAQSYLGFITEGSKRAQILIRDLLAYNRCCRADIKKQYIQVDDLIMLQAYKLKGKLNKDESEITVDCEGMILADSHWLGVVFKHLIQNSIIHNQNKRPKLHFTVDVREQDYLIALEDNGIGISDNHHDMVFQLMKKVDGRLHPTSSGVGLSMVKKIIQLHGGKVWFESELGKGSTFYISLPME